MFAVIEALGRLGGEGAVSYLLMVAHDDVQLKAAAVKALGMTRSKAAIEPLTTILKYLFERAFKKADDEEVAVEIVQAIREIGAPAEIEAHWLSIHDSITSEKVRNKINNLPPPRRGSLRRRTLSDRRPLIDRE